ncbi:MAG: GHKL domain-containing protein [Clostridia bacterium]|nr:GHKL domain-containing protein [Clostridia bacterium]
MQKVNFILVIAFLSYLIISINKILKMNKKQKRIEDLESSNKRLQANYDNVRAFKHDFNNIMQSIGGYIILNDMDGLKEMYNAIVKECQDINNSQSINQNVINNPAIYHLINNKYELAEKNDIKMKVDVLFNLNKIRVSDYDICRILGILIDNALEAAMECDDKFVSIKFVYDSLNRRYLIIIENPFKNSLIDINKIYEKGFSSKKKKIDHGLGLWKVKQILKKNKNMMIYTSRDKLFKQQLEIY